MTERAVILAGGQGRRLAPYTAILPKPLMPLFEDKSVLEHVLTGVAAAGINDVTITPGYLGHFIRLSGFRLLVAGVGGSAGHVRRMQASGGPVVYLGRVEGARKALALKAADIMAIPQWVGLVAVDSLVAGRPIVTTRHSSHSPEYGYLTDGINAIMSDHDVLSYASAVVTALQDPVSLAAMQTRAINDSRHYSLSGMVGRFAGGVRDWVAAP